MHRDGFPQSNPDTRAALSAQDVLSELSFMDSQLQAMGAVDSEHAQIDQIRQSLLSGTTPPEKAIAQARAIMNERSEDH